MPTLVQWIHLTAAVIAVGGIGFLLVFLLPSTRRLNAEQRDLLMRTVMRKFRWASWSAIVLLFLSGLYNIRQFYWDVNWGTAWKYLTLKVVLAMIVFAISLCLTLPLKFFDRFRARRQLWLFTALALAIIVIYISAYLRRG
jgi:uncharacterized membrane protein